MILFHCMNALSVWTSGSQHKMKPIPGTVMRVKNLWLGRSKVLEKNIVLLLFQRNTVLNPLLMNSRHSFLSLKPHQRSLFMVWLMTKTETYSWSKVEPQMGYRYRYHNSSCQDSGIIGVEKVESLLESEKVDDYKEMVFSWVNKAVAHLNSQLFWQHVQDLSNPDKILSWRGEEVRKS